MKKGVCVYCETKGPVTRDHVPPKALFASPRPHLITVPACPDCHKKAAGDDEYFVSRISLRHTTGQNPDAVDARGRFVRSLKRPDKRGWRRAFYDTVKQVDVQTPAGIYLGKTGAFDVDLDRVTRVVARIVRGLYYHQLGNRLSTETEVEAFAVDGLADLDEDGRKAVATIASPVMTAPEQIVGDQQTFRYQFRAVPEEPEATAWLLTFYDSTKCFAITLPRRLDGGHA